MIEKIKGIELTDEDGNILYPETNTKMVKTENGSNLDIILKSKTNYSPVTDENINIEYPTIFDDVNKHEEQIKKIEDEFNKKDNKVLSTINGVCEFESKNGYATNFKMKGETLFNIFKANNVTWTENDKKTYMYFRDSESIKMVQVNKMYTLKNTTNKKISIRFRSTGSEVIRDIQPNGYATYSTGSNVSTLTDITLVAAYSDGWSFIEENKKILEKSLVILEGDHVTKEITYFEGIKSIGQGDKIEVLNCDRGNDLIPEYLTFTNSNYVNSFTGLAEPHNEFKYSGYIDIDENTEYVFWNINLQFAIYDVNKNVIPIDWREISQFIGDNYQSIFFYTMPKGTKFIRINLPLNNIKTYGLYKNKYDKKLISTTLRSTHNDSDEIKGNMKIERCGTGVLTDNNCASTYSEVQGEYIIFRIEFPFSNLKPNTKLLNTVLPNKYVYSSHEEGIYTNDSFIWLKISIQKLSKPNYNALLEWLKANPIPMIYELVRPIITELPNFDPIAFEGNNTLLINSGVVQADTEFEVTGNLRSEMDVLKDKTSDIDNFLLMNNESIKTLDHKLNSSLGKLGFSDADFSSTDLSINLEKIIKRLGGGCRFHIYVYNGYANNLNMSIKNYLGTRNIDGYGLEIITTTNTNCSNPIYIYPNNTSDMYILNHDSGLRKLGKVAFTASFDLLDEQVQSQVKRIDILDQKNKLYQNEISDLTEQVEKLESFNKTLLSVLEASNIIDMKKLTLLSQNIPDTKK